MTQNILVSLLLVLPALAHAASTSGVALKSSAATLEYGHSVTFTATVSPASATGHVTFYRGTMVLETEPVLNGVAAFTTSLLPSGGHSFDAYYSGDATYAPSTSAAVSVKVKTVPSKGFGAPIVSPFSGALVTFTVGDFNGDGKADLAVLNSFGELALALGNGDGTFGVPVISPGYFGLTMVVGDFNGDGKEDIALQTFPFGVEVALGNGDGTFQPQVTSTSGGYEAREMAVGDFNSDGKADLAILNSGSAGVDVILGNGDGTFQTAITYAADIDFPLTVVVGDFNGDGRADLAVNSDGVSILLGNGDGTFQNALSGVEIGNIDYLATGDFNGDGKTDLAISIFENAAVQLGNGDGTFQQPVYIPLTGFVLEASIAVGDFNGDGKPDVFGFTFGQGVAAQIGVALGNGDGTFQSVQTSLALYPSVGSLVLADFNGDGRVDVVQGPYNSSWPPAVFLGSSLAPSTTALSSSPNPSEVGAGITLTANIVPATSAGSVAFYYYSYSTFVAEMIGKGAVTDGVATATVSKLPGGMDGLYAVYGGDTQVLPSDSTVVAQQVNFYADSVVLYSSPNPSALGQTVTLVATVKPAAATGTVSFLDSGVSLGTATLVSGKATITTSTLSEGSHSLSASYGGSAKYESNYSASINQVVN